MSAFADDIAKALWSAGRELHGDKKRRDRDAVRADRHRRSRNSTREMTIKEAVFSVMAAAAAAASGDGAYNVSARTLYYQVRPRIQEGTHRDLNYGYFSQDLLIEYQQCYGPIVGLYRDPRGALHEPHTEKSIPLGTLEVASYRLPEYVFDKILYVEKEGLDPIWRSSRLGDRYDLAIASGKGQPVEAVRALFERAEAGEYRLFVLHDADDAGYSIARAMAEETKRMPGYSVDVVDLGLFVADAVSLGLPTESYTRRKSLPRWMPSRLDATETDWFCGQRSYGSQWQCTRVELNAFTAPNLVAYVEAGLAAHGADQKIMPPDDVIAKHAADSHRDAIEGWVEDRLAEWYDVDRLVDVLVEETADIPKAGDSHPAEWISDAYEVDRGRYWRKVVDDQIAAGVEDRDGELRPRLRELLDEIPVEGTDND